MLNFVILANEQPNDHELWVKACENKVGIISYRVVDITKNTWLDDIKKEKVDFLLAKPGGVIDSFKKLYDERLQILVKELGYSVFPSLNEVLIYENKRYLSFWLSANRIPHPRTDVFYTKQEALAFIDNTVFPIVAKLNIGASGNGVSVIKTKEEAKVYITKLFKTGITARTGPRMDKGGILKRAGKLLLNPSALMNKLRLYKSIATNPQRDFCLFQEFIPHNYEWRVVRIGDSFFAHKKIVKGEKASGSLIKGYENPPLSILNFVKEVTDKHDFKSQAIDIFEIEKEGYLVNEMQCIFGQSDPYQMLVDGIPGRYRHLEGQWVFEPGMFNTNECFDLRLEYVLQNHIK